MPRRAPLAARIADARRLAHPVKMCPNGGTGWSGSIRHGVQLNTKMNMEDSKELQMRPQSKIFLSSTIAAMALPKLLACPSLCP